MVIVSNINKNVDDAIKNDKRNSRIFSRTQKQQVNKHDERKEICKHLCVLEITEHTDTEKKNMGTSSGMKQDIGLQKKRVYLLSKSVSYHGRG